MNCYRLNGGCNVIRPGIEGLSVFWLKKMLIRGTRKKEVFPKTSERKIKSRAQIYGCGEHNYMCHVLLSVQAKEMSLFPSRKTLGMNIGFVSTRVFMMLLFFWAKPSWIITLLTSLLWKVANLFEQHTHVLKLFPGF